MKHHHTKNKGDLGVAQAIGDLVEKGWGILLPMTEHAPFDLVAFRDETFLRTQVKYRAAVRGAVFFRLQACWADRNGAHWQPIDRSAIDLFCVYCPDTRTCYYVDPAKVRAATMVSLRITPARNNQAKACYRPKTSPISPLQFAGFTLVLDRHLRNSRSCGTVVSRERSIACAHLAP